MGTQSYSAVGRGMTQAEARQNAVEQDRAENGHQEGYTGTIGSSRSDSTEKVVCIKQPKKAKRCNVEKVVQKGARKWETVYVLDAWPSSIRNVVRGSQGDAIKKAKALALETGRSIRIDIEKRLVSTVGNKIAVVHPKKSEMGEWRFSGDARC